ncbi:MAG: LacI family DNA-binding transcriptional regulator [Oscillospiraceae bacterium]|jgi:LacI family transcriptional regulator
MATIKQIANLAGVSRGTVDRVLNNRGIVNPETAKKIKKIAETVNYRPNKIAKTLAVKKKNIKLGFIMFSTINSNPFFEDVVTGIKEKTRELEEYGVSVEMRFTEFGNHRQQLELFDELISNGVQGIAITPINHPEVAKKIKNACESGVPVVTVNTDIENSGRLAYVGSNYTQCGKTAAGLARLLTGENANIAVIVGSMNVLCHSERVSGFTNSIKKHCPGHKIIQICENHDDDFESFSIAKNILTEHPETDLLFLAAGGVYGACRAVETLGLQKKLKIISVDCVPTTKKLLQSGVISATIDQQPFKQGSEPLDILFNYLGMGIPPEKDGFFTNIEIIIRENLI